MASIDLNADIGEGASTDADLLKVISSANICCGAHAGSLALTRHTIELAHKARVRIGAHPGYPDRATFGRTRLDQPVGRTVAQITEQVSVFAAIARNAGAEVAYIKLHGALYNQAAQSLELAEALMRAVSGSADVTTWMGPPNSELATAAAKIGLTFISEGFADRRYQSDGTLMPRDQPGAVFTEIKEIAAQAQSIALGEEIMTNYDHRILIEADTICLHGDNGHVLVAAQLIRQNLIVRGINISAS